jgi:protease-4
MRQLVIVFVVLLVIAVGASVVGLLLTDGAPGLSGPTVISWHLDGRLMDYEPRPNFPLGEATSPTSLIDVYKALVTARTDPAVKGLALSLHNTGFGLAKAQEIRRLLLALRDAGKFVECYLEAGGEGANGTLAFYVATACGTIHLAPAADLNLLGLHANLTSSISASTRARSRSTLNTRVRPPRKRPSKRFWTTTTLRSWGRSRQRAS